MSKFLKASFQLEPKYQFMGQNRSGLAAALYWQACPVCDKFIVCIKESSNGNEVLGELKSFTRDMKSNISDSLVFRSEKYFLALCIALVRNVPDPHAGSIILGVTELSLCQIFNASFSIISLSHSGV
jgi:hypothetical protein